MRFYEATQSFARPDEKSSTVAYPLSRGEIIADDDGDDDDDDDVGIQEASQEAKRAMTEEAQQHVQAKFLQGQDKEYFQRNHRTLRQRATVLIFLEGGSEVLGCGLWVFGWKFQEASQYRCQIQRILQRDKDMMLRSHYTRRVFFTRAYFLLAIIGGGVAQQTKMYI